MAVNFARPVILKETMWEAILLSISIFDLRCRIQMGGCRDGERRTSPPEVRRLSEMPFEGTQDALQPHHFTHHKGVPTRSTKSSRETRPFATSRRIEIVSLCRLKGRNVIEVRR